MGYSLQAPMKTKEGRQHAGQSLVTWWGFGAAASGIVVEARTPAGTLVKTTTTDGAGAFTVTGLAPGTYIVHYADPAGVLAGTYHPGVNLVGAATPFTIGVGDTATANIALVTGGGLSGVVRIGSGSQPAVGITALAIDTTTVELVGSAVTDAAGSYTIRGLAPGSYKVAWLDPVLFTDPADSLRSVVAPAIDLASVGTPTVHATGATYAVTASTFAPVPNGPLSGWGCGSTLFVPGADRNHTDLTGADLRSCAFTRRIRRPQLGRHLVHRECQQQLVQARPHLHRLRGPWPHPHRIVLAGQPPVRASPVSRSPT